jgi:FKBP-type peptidyl-prolyl cis-trans isomerase
MRPKIEQRARKALLSRKRNTENQGGTTIMTQKPTPPAVLDDVFIIDEVIGEGLEAGKHSSFLDVHYTLWLRNPDGTPGEEVQSTRGQDTFTFPLKSGYVIQGWEIGLMGMKVGGRRTLHVPSRLAYGARGAREIPPHSDLIFDIELLSA